MGVEETGPSIPEISKVDIREGANPFGVHLYYPRKGDQTFDAPLPSAKTLHPTLKYLDETKGLSGAFAMRESTSADAKLIPKRRDSFP